MMEQETTGKEIVVILEKIDSILLLVQISI